jgi:sec-independent protein translocase protein TatA
MSHTFAFIDGLGGPELLLLMVVVLILFGADRLPELARGMGKSIREFKKAAAGVEEEIRQALEETPETKRTPPSPAKPADTVAAPPPEAKFPPDPPPGGAVPPELPPGD